MSTHEVSPARADTPQVRNLIQGLVSGLNAYQREVRLYPAGHPRLRSRVEALLEIVREAFQRESQLLLEVVDSGLRVNSVEVPDESHSSQLIKNLRLRMIRSIRIARGVNEKQVLGLANLLSQDPDHEQQPAELRLGDQMTVHYFRRTADLLGEEDEMVGDRVGAERLHEQLHRGDWGEFEVSELEWVSEVLRNESVKRRIGELEEALGTAEEGLSFAASFFRALKKEGQTDWSDLTKLRDMTLAGLDLLSRAGDSQKQISAIPTKLLTASEGRSDQLSTHLRWVLLQKFYPDVQTATSPRQAEDLAFTKTKPQESTPPQQNKAEEPAKAAEQSDKDEKESAWIPPARHPLTDSNELKQELKASLDDVSLLAEFTEVVGELVTQDRDQSTREFRASCLGTLKGQLPQERRQVEELEPLFEGSVGLPDELRVAWLVETICAGVGAPQLLDAVSRRDALLRAQLLDRPCDLDTPQPIEGSASEAREVLRRILAVRDEFGLDALRAVLTGPDRERAVAGGWLHVGRKICDRNAQLAPWLEKHQEQLVQRDHTWISLCVGPDLLEGWLSQLHITAPHLLQTLLRNLPSRDKPDATAVIEACLKIDSTPVRVSAFKALGRQRDEWSLSLLLEQTRKNNSAIISNEDEARALCYSLAQRPESAAEELLQQIPKQKSWFLPFWKRHLRALAGEALGQRSGHNDSAAP